MADKTGIIIFTGAEGDTSEVSVKQSQVGFKVPLGAMYIGTKKINKIGDVNNIIVGDDTDIYYQYQQPVDGYLTLDKESVKLTPTSLNAIIKVTTNATWTATTDADWLTLSIEGNVLTVTTTAQDADKSASITFSTSGYYYGITKTIEANYKLYTPLTFEAISDNTTVSLNIKASTYEHYPNVQYSLNGTDWVNWNYSAISLNTGDKLSFKGSNGTKFNYSNTQCCTFITSSKIKCYGNVMSLIDNCTGTLEVGSYCFVYLFADTLITTAPELPATTLGTWCYDDMFLRCKELTTAPELPATAISFGCYYGMFDGCTGLTTAPELPATTLAGYCYNCMFLECTNLSKVITYASDISATSCLGSWLRDVSSTGDFYNLGGAAYSSGVSGIPTGWTEHTSL